MIVAWSLDALDDWRRLALQDAERVAQAVARVAERWEGVVVFMDGAYHLFVGRHVVLFAIDHEADVLHVLQVRRA